jgi:hypothetical protein
VDARYEFKLNDVSEQTAASSSLASVPVPNVAETLHHALAQAIKRLCQAQQTGRTSAVIGSL